MGLAQPGEGLAQLGGGIPGGGRSRLGGILLRWQALSLQCPARAAVRNQGGSRG